MPVVASNRIGTEKGEKYTMTFYGSSFIASHDRRESGRSGSRQRDGADRRPSIWTRCAATGSRGACSAIGGPICTIPCCRSMDAAEVTLPQDLVFVDLETTGGNAAYHRITEIGIVRVQNGELVEEWSSLVNPECPIPAYIERFTGISNEMVAGAPRFADIAAARAARSCAARYSWRTTRASIIRSCAPSFARLGMAFLRQGAVHRQTVAALVSRARAPQSGCGDGAPRARRAAPGIARSAMRGAAAISGSSCAARCPQPRSPPRRRPCSARTSCPRTCRADLADELPEGPGVYRFFGADDVLLYVGRSNSLRTRVLRPLRRRARRGSSDRQLGATGAARRLGGDRRRTRRDAARGGVDQDAAAALQPARQEQQRRHAVTVRHRRGRRRAASSAVGHRCAGASQISTQCFGVFHSEQGCAQGADRHRPRAAAVPQGLGARGERGFVLRPPGRKVQGRLRRQGTARSCTTCGCSWPCRR